MNTLDRRTFLKNSTALIAAAQFAPILGRLKAETATSFPAAESIQGAKDWIRHPRIAIAEGFNPPFHPSLDYVPKKAVDITVELGADAMRYPTASYYAFFPTKSGYPIHPELKGDPMRETLALLRQAGLKAVAYIPLNHPFMDAHSSDPRYSEWCKRFADGTPMTTPHYGYGTYFEGCLNSRPLREVIKTLVREVLTEYEYDVMYFDGPYQGMRNQLRICHCSYCGNAYRQRFSRELPVSETNMSRADQYQYHRWMADEVAIGFFQEIRDYIKATRDVPVVFNDTSLLSRQGWRNRAVPVADGFMFEAANSPEEKLFNLQLGQSTGKVVWTYIGHHTEYNREHLKDDSVRGWYSYPLESDELLLDGATAIAAGVGLVYWSVARFAYETKGPKELESGRNVRETFGLHERLMPLLAATTARPQVGILVSTQTIDWHADEFFVPKAYKNYFHGAFRVLKASGYEAEPFLDWQMTPQRLKTYAAIYVPNAICLSDAQCQMLTDYVQAGGRMIVTHLSATADETGRPRDRSALDDFLGIRLTQRTPWESPDLYLKLPDGRQIPQDPQIARFGVTDATVLATTLDRGRRAEIGPAVVQKANGQGETLYIGSGLEAIYQETQMDVVRAYLASLLKPWLEAGRTYEVESVPGVMPHFRASDRHLMLHLLANTGSRTIYASSRARLVASAGGAVRLRLPKGRKVSSAELLVAGRTLPYKVRDGWLEATVPPVRVHEIVKVTLS